MLSLGTCLQGWQSLFEQVRNRTYPGKSTIRDFTCEVKAFWPSAEINNGIGAVRDVAVTLKMCRDAQCGPRLECPEAP